MMLMKEKVMVTRKAGHWEGNTWVDDPIDPFPIRATVLPLPGDSTGSGEDGRRRNSVISVTTKKALYAVSSDRNADLLEWNGEQYEVKSVKPLGTGTRLAHYKATAESLEDHIDAPL